MNFQMKKLKEFIQGKKVERKFKSLGQGQSLSSQSGYSQGNSLSNAPSSNRYQPNVNDTQQSEERRRLAAEAIERRLNQGKGDGMTHSQKAIHMQAKRELEKEQRQLNQGMEKNLHLSQPSQEVPRGKSEEPEEDSSILYTCDLLEEALPKSQMYEAIETYLRAQLDEEPLDAAVLMLCSLNSASRLEPTVQTLQKYLNNVISDPGEIKFRKIRTSNKVFAEKIAPTTGAVEFLKAVGFERKNIVNEETNETETFMVLEEPNCALLNDALEELETGNTVTLKLFRDPKVFIVDPSQPIPSPSIPTDFFQLSSAEVRALQAEKKQEAERMTTLRTRKMREEDEQALAAARGVKPTSVYKYTLIRVCFPNNFILQGVFNVHESILAVREFVSQRLELESGVFNLAIAGGGILADSEKSLLQCGLLPSALLHFRWDDSTLEYFDSNRIAQTFLAPSLQQMAECMTPS